MEGQSSHPYQVHQLRDVECFISGMMCSYPCAGLDVSIETRMPRACTGLRSRPACPMGCSQFRHRGGLHLSIESLLRWPRGPRSSGRWLPLNEAGQLKVWRALLRRCFYCSGSLPKLAQGERFRACECRSHEANIVQVLIGHWRPRVCPGHSRHLGSRLS